MPADTQSLIAELERVGKHRTAGRWKLWGMSVVADPKGTSDFNDGILVATTYMVDPNGRPRTFDADLMCAAANNLDAILTALRESVAKDAEIERLRQIADISEIQDRMLASLGTKLDKAKHDRDRYAERIELLNAEVSTLGNYVAELRSKVAQLKAASPFQTCPACERPRYAAARCEHCGHKSPLARLMAEGRAGE